MHSKLKRNQSDKIPNKELQVVVNNIRRYLRGNNNEYKTNSVTIGMKCLFREFSIKV